MQERGVLPTLCIWGKGPMRDTIGLPNGSPVRLLEECDVVITLQDIRDDDDQIVPAGSRGVIVDVSRAAGYFMVEFEQPFPSVVTMTRSQLI